MSQKPQDNGVIYLLAFIGLCVVFGFFVKSGLFNVFAWIFGGFLIYTVYIKGPFILLKSEKLSDKFYGLVGLSFISFFIWMILDKTLK